MEIGLSLGSNLGDRLANLREAAMRIAALAGVKLIASSPVYETEPVDVPAEFSDKPFLNAVAIVSSDLPIEELYGKLRTIEDDMGRRRGIERNAPRPLDVDIIYAGTARVKTDKLIVPHPRWAERRFVAQPLADLRPDLTLPGESRTVKEVLAALPARPAVRLLVSEL